MTPSPRRTSLLLRLAAVCVLLPGFGLAAEATLSAGIEAKLGQLTTDRRPGMAVLAARDGKVVYQGGFGFADLEKKVPVTADTRFRIGSVTKQFTAAAVLRLAESGKLALADPLAKFFPDFPGAAGITVQQLLNHTSGIHSYTEKPEFMSRVTAPVEPGKLIAWFRRDPPDFAPGKGFRYNNSAYFLAGEIVAKVSAKPFADCLQDLFFTPLGMKHTGIFVNAAPPAGAAAGYSMTDGKADAAIDWDMSWAGGAGALYSTVGDLFLWNEALHGGRVLKPDSYKLMTTPVPLPPGVDGMSYGLGLVIADVQRLPALSHSGGLNGWTSDLLRLPDQHCTVVALANAMPPVPEFEPTAVTRRIAAKFLEADIKKLPPPAVPAAAAADPSSLPDFAGRYDYQNAILTVTVEEGRLFARLTGQDKYEVVPTAKDSFAWKVTAASVTFVRDDKGRVTAARHTQGGNTFTAPRIADTDPVLTDAELAAVTGKYQYGPGIVMTVTSEGPLVFAQLTGQPRLRIHARSATEFEWREVKASVRFIKGKDGTVTKAAHTQNGATFEAPKITENR